MLVLCEECETFVNFFLSTRLSACFFQMFHNYTLHFVSASAMAFVSTISDGRTITTGLYRRSVWRRRQKNRKSGRRRRNGGAEDSVIDKRKRSSCLIFEQETPFCITYNYPLWIYIYVVYQIFISNTYKAGFPICGQPLPDTVQAGSRFPA